MKSRKVLFLSSLLLVPLFIWLRQAGDDNKAFVRFLHPFLTVRDTARNRGCQRGEHYIGLALRQYTADYDGRYPVTVSGPSGAAVGWEIEIIPYISDTSFYLCHADPRLLGTPPQSNLPGYTSYYLNARIAGLSARDLQIPTSTLLLADGNAAGDNSDANYSKSAFPPAWLGDTVNPANRHLGGANYLMADGTVHWLRPKEVVSFGGRQNIFAP